MGGFSKLFEAFVNGPEDLPALAIGSVVIGSVGIWLWTNVKCLPGVWHLKLFYHILDQLYFRRAAPISSASKIGVQALFRPVTTTSYAAPLEIDFNLHKSNSTFFSDLDLSRTELILTLFKDLLAPTSPGIKKRTMALGGVSCSFKRQILPFEKYDICSRVLCWDTKWLYVVSHFVKHGAGRVGTAASQGEGDSKSPCMEFPSPTAAGFEKEIFASSIAKYVFKSGRITVAPEEALLEARLIPSPINLVVCGDSPPTAGGSAAAAGRQGTDQEWAREQCQQGMQLAKNFADLDGLHSIFNGHSDAAKKLYSVN